MAESSPNMKIVKDWLPVVIVIVGLITGWTKFEARLGTVQAQASDTAAQLREVVLPSVNQLKTDNAVTIQSMKDIKDRLDRIEAKQDAILRLLK